MANHSDKRHRTIGLFALGIASGMMIWGNLVFRPFLHGAAAVAYWISCLAFALSAVLVAATEIWQKIRELRDARRRKLQDALQGLPALPDAPRAHRAG